LYRVEEVEREDPPQARGQIPWKWIAAISAGMILLFSVLPDSESDPLGSTSSTGEPQAAAVGQCAYNRSDSQYLGPIVDVGPLGYRGMADQRAISVIHPEIGRMDVTYPRNATVAACN
jgi:hypothetical protein